MSAPLIVAEFSVRAMTVSVEGSEEWVSLTTTDGIEVEVPAELIRDAWPLRPRADRCEYDAGGIGCMSLVDPNGPDDGRCETHESTRRGD